MTKNFTHDRIGKTETIHQSEAITTALNNTKANKSNADVGLSRLTGVDCDKGKNRSACRLKD
jgi:hypothetical protein